MEITLNRMTMQNFKGFKHFEVNFTQNTHISGANGTGKSSIQDAFLWLLFNKDSNGNAAGTENFKEKPLGPDGQEVHNLTTSVEADFTIDGKALSLKKEQNENWIKRRGAEEAEYAGNTTSYFINEVPVKLKDYTAKIGEFANEKVFRYITTLGAFNALNWKDRRSILLELTNSNLDEEMLLEAEFEPLRDALPDGVGVEDYKQIVSSHIKRINEELRLLPARIDEAKNMLPASSKSEVVKAVNNLTLYEQNLAAINKEIANTNTDTLAQKLQLEVSAKQSELEFQKKQEKADYESKLFDISKKLEHSRQQLAFTQNKLAYLDTDIIAKQQSIATHEQKLIELREQYKKIYEEQYQGQVDEYCPTCQQYLPDHMLEKAKAKDIADFNLRKKNKLEELNSLGKNIKAAKENRESLITSLEKELAQGKNELEQVKETIVFLEAEKSTIQLEDSKSKELELELEKLQTQLESHGDDDGLLKENLAKLNEKKELLKIKIAETQKIISNAELAEKIAKRIEELEAKQKDFGIQIAEKERQLFLIENFIQARCTRLEDGINQHFPSIRWKLFDRQINGALNPTCICMIPCHDALVSYNTANTASKVNADIEIINVLAKHYDVSAPLFIDNAERVNELAHTDTQIITLTVDNCPKLTIR